VKSAGRNFRVFNLYANHHRVVLKHPLEGRYAFYVTCATNRHSPMVTVTPAGPACLCVYSNADHRFIKLFFTVVNRRQSAHLSILARAVDRSRQHNSPTDNPSSSHLQVIHRGYHREIACISLVRSPAFGPRISSPWVNRRSDRFSRRRIRLYCSS